MSNSRSSPGPARRRSRRSSTTSTTVTATWSVGSVLVEVIDDVEPNRPPVVTADTDKVVVGQSVDHRGDGQRRRPRRRPADRRVGHPARRRTVGKRSCSAVTRSSSPRRHWPTTRAQANARFTYTVSDGNGHEVAGEVTVTVLPEPLAEPPFARDDSTFTFVDVPVTVDVLRNDGDPSGGRPTIVGRPGCPSGGQGDGDAPTARCASTRHSGSRERSAAPTR